MKKRLTGILLVFCLLIAVFAFASCVPTEEETLPSGAQSLAAPSGGEIRALSADSGESDGIFDGEAGQALLAVLIFGGGFILLILVIDFGAVGRDLSDGEKNDPEVGRRRREKLRLRREKIAARKQAKQEKRRHAWIAKETERMRKVQDKRDRKLRKKAEKKARKQREKAERVALKRREKQRVARAKAAEKAARRARKTGRR